MSGGVVGGIVDFIQGIHQRQLAARTNDVMKNYLNDPQGTVKAMMQVNPTQGIALQNQYDADQDAQHTDEVAQQAAHATNLQRVTGYLRGLPPGTTGDQYGAAIEGMRPYLGTIGMSSQDIDAAKGAVAANPNLVASLDDNLMKARDNALYHISNVAPGGAVAVGGQITGRNPALAKPVTLRGGDGSSTLYGFDPNTGGLVGSGASAPGAPAGGAPAMAAPGQPAVALNGNNTGGILNGKFAASQPGYAGANGRYAAFDTLTHGEQAHQNLAQRYLQQGFNTPQTYANRWVNGDVNKPAPAAYVQGIAKALGIGPNDPIPPNAIAQLQRAQATQENSAYGRAPAPGGGGAPAPGGALATSAPKPVPAGKGVRNATPDEIKAAGYPDGTAAQIDGNGRFVNMRTPKGGPGGPTTPAAGMSTYQDGMSELNTLEQNLRRLRDDPGLGNATGALGSLTGRIPGTHAQGLHSLADQINAQKMVNLVKYMKQSGGNPFQRITQQEALMLPKTLAPLDFSQNADDFRAGIDRGLATIAGMRQRMTSDATRRGYLGGQSGGGRQSQGGGAPAASSGPPVGATATNPNTGRKVRWNGQSWAPVR